MKVVPVPVLQDNYAYLLIDEEEGIAACIDPVEPRKVIDAAFNETVRIVKVLTTHKHWDHAGGNVELAKAIPEVQVYGGEIDQVDGCTHSVKDGDEFSLGSISVKCLHTPGHTMGHICYYATQGEEKVVFTGDCLFVGGCGRFFEGTAKDYYFSLYERLYDLPPETKVYCGHEYTLANYRFAMTVDPENADLKEQIERAKAKRKENQATVPSTIGVELSTNPFLRVTSGTLKVEWGSALTPAERLGRVRLLKDHFVS